MLLLLSILSNISFYALYVFALRHGLTFSKFRNILNGTDNFSLFQDHLVMPIPAMGTVFVNE